jgi:hypothetical protein
MAVTIENSLHSSVMFDTFKGLIHRHFVAAFSLAKCWTSWRSSSISKLCLHFAICSWHKQQWQWQYKTSRIPQSRSTLLGAVYIGDWLLHFCQQKYLMSQDWAHSLSCIYILWCVVGISNNGSDNWKHLSFLSHVWHSWVQFTLLIGCCIFISKNSGQT